MTDSTPAPRRYSDDEVRALLERATELQLSDPSIPDPSGLTLAQLESIAREAGIDVEAVRRAAMEMDTGAAPGPEWARRLMGEPAQLVLERALPGEASRESLEELVPLIQSVADVVGQVTVTGRTLTWQARDPTSLRDLNVAVTARSGETRVRVEERYGGLAGAVFGSGMGGVGAGVGVGVGVAAGVVTSSTLLMIGFPLTVLGLTYVGSRAIYSGIVARRRRVLERLLAQLVEAVTADATGRDLPSTDRPALPAGDADERARGAEPGTAPDPDTGAGG